MPVVALRSRTRLILGVAALFIVFSQLTSTEAFGQRWLQRFGVIGTNKNERSHKLVKTAFTEVVATPRTCTVEVLSGEGKVVALGAVVNPNGYILTKASELRGNTKVRWSDEREEVAEIVGLDRDTDLAMLKVEATGLPVVQWRDGAPLAGSWLATPGMDEIPVAIGVVGASARKIDAPSGILGIMLDQDEKGPRVDQVMPKSGAEKAGMQVNDIVLAVNGEKVATREALIRIVRRFQPGERIRLKILRGGKEQVLPAVLGNRSAFDDSDQRRDFQNNLGGSLSDRRTGFPSALQHDTVLKPAECGGPIVDLDGKAIGINIARAGRTSSLALPAAIVQPLIKSMIAGEKTPDPSIRREIESLSSKKS